MNDTGMGTKTLDFYLTLPYATTVYTDRCGEDICYVAINPELPGCMAQGSTPSEAVANLREARAAYIETLLEEDLPVPAPRETAEIIGPVSDLRTGYSATFLIGHGPHISKFRVNRVETVPEPETPTFSAPNAQLREMSTSTVVLA